MESTVTPNRKTGRLIAKNLIILLVLFAIAMLSIFAWFTKNKTANASGINLQATANGIEVSWDGKEFYENLTALTAEDAAKDETGKTGLAKSLLNADGEPASLDLVTGNGIRFFEPLLNRRTGLPLSNNGVWQGSKVTGDGTGKYIDIELYFRSDTARDIYLAADSAVNPKDITQRISDYGDFSQDYICAASRVAFLNENKDDDNKSTYNCNYIWAPNSNYELTEDENGYTKVTDVKQTEVSSGGNNIPPEILTTDNNKQYYFWLPDKYTTDGETIVSEYTPIPMAFEEYEEGKGLFVCSFTIYTPSRDNPSIPFFISQNNKSWSSADFSNVNVNNSSATNDKSDRDPKVAISNGTYNLSNGQASMFYLSGFNLEETEVTFGYNPDTKTTIVLKYSGGDKSFDRTEPGELITVNYYELENNSSVVLANVDSAMAVSSNNDKKKSIRFKNSDMLNILPVSVTTSELFTVKKTGEGYGAAYEFLNVATGKYIEVSNGDVKLSDTGSSFVLDNISGFDGPVLKCGNYYLIYNGRKFAAYTKDSFDIKDFTTVFTGSSYKLNTNSNKSQTYNYYDWESNTVIELSETSTPPLFATATGGSATTKVGNAKILTLKKESDEANYYTGKIVMRIWVEGTDRDALTPLANGIFDLSLHFISC